MVEIDKKSFKIKSDLFVKTITNKKRIILTDTLRNDIQSSVNFYNIKKRFPNFTIDKDGKIYEHVLPIYYSDYYNDKNINTDSIIISLVNSSWVSYKNSENKYYNWAYEEINFDNVIECSWNNNRYWDSYTVEQTTSLAELCKILNETHNVPLNSIFDNIYTPSSYLFSGVISESNLYKWSNSLNPTFGFNLLRKIFS